MSVKKFGSIAITMFLMSIFTIAANATTLMNVYELPELNMDVYIPKEYVVFTRDDMDSSDLNAYGLTKDGLLSLMQERNIYLNAWDETVAHELVVTMIESPLSDFGLFSDTMLEIIAASCGEEYETVGASYIRSEIYQNDQAKYIKIYISQPAGDTTAYGLQYYTVYNGMAINFTLHSYTGAINTTQERTLKTIVDQTHFYTAPERASVAEATPQFTYYDSETGLKFTVPENWAEAEITEGQEALDAKFVCNEDDGSCILFSSMNGWDELSDMEKATMSKSDIDNSYFTKADIAEIFMCEESDVVVNTYGGKEYYQVTTSETHETDGLSVSISMTCLVHVENGYMYLFQFSGTSNSKQFSAFKTLVSSAVYPSNPSISDSPTGFETDMDSNDSLDQLGMQIANVIVSLFLTIAVYSLPIMIYRYCIRKSAVDQGKAKKITIIYGILAFVVMSLMLSLLNGTVAAGAAIFLWSWVNYRILTVGQKPQNNNASSAEDDNSYLLIKTTANLPVVEQTVDNEPMAPIAKEPVPNPKDISLDVQIYERTKTENAATLHPINKKTPLPTTKSTNTLESKFAFCHKCGANLIPESFFCSKCGSKIPTVEDF